MKHKGLYAACGQNAEHLMLNIAVYSAVWMFWRALGHRECSFRKYRKQCIQGINTF